MSEYKCADLDEVAVDLSLGTLTGTERARALSHVATCPRCAAVVNDLTEAGNALLLLAPHEQPPLGFESRVAAGIAASSPSPSSSPSPGRRRMSPWRGVAVAAALVAASVLGVVTGRVVTPASRPAGARVALASADGGTSLCRAVLFAGSPARLVVTIDEPGESGSADYVVETEVGGGNRTETVGSLRVVDGHGVLSAPVPGQGNGVRSVRVFQAGQMRYEARFR